MRKLSAGACAGIACVLVVCLSDGAAAQAINLARIDLNRNGVIDATGEEARIYALHKENPVYRKYDTNFNGRLDLSEIAKYEDDEIERTARAREDHALQTRAGIRVEVPKPAPAKPPKDGPEEKSIWETDWRFILRRNYEAVTLFSTFTTGTEYLKELAKVPGAEFGWQYDRIINNRAWSMNGIVALPFIVRNVDDSPLVDRPYFLGAAVTPSLRFERVSNSRIVARDVEKLTFAVTSEAAIANLFATTHYFRLRGGVVTDFDANPKSWLVAAEWQPVSTRYRLGAVLPLPGLPFTLRFTPKLYAEYAGVVDNSAIAAYPIFAQRSEALRAGPILSLDIDGIKLPIFPRRIQAVHVNVSYYWLHDFFTQRQYSLLDSTLALPLDDDGHFALSASYRRGEIEETGQSVNITKVGLSAKF